MRSYRYIGSLLVVWMICFGEVAIAVDTPQTDKAAHFAVSSLGVATTLKFFQWLHPEKKVTGTARFIASSLLLSLGAAKEIDDATKQKALIDAGDMAANIGGVIYGNFLMIEF